jgi:RNA polymerase sigma factor (sigma-70 family)
VLLAVVDDLLRRHGTDSGKRVEVVDGRRVQVHRPGRCRRSGVAVAARALRRGHGGADRNDHLRPVGNLRGEVDETEIGAAACAAGAADGVCDPRAVREAVKAWSPNGADDVDDYTGLFGRLDFAGNGRWTLDGRRSASDEEFPADEQRRDEQYGAHERARTRDLKPVHVVDFDNNRRVCLSRDRADGVTNSAVVAYMRCMRSPRVRTTSLADAAERHLDDVYRYVLYLTRDPHAAEDLAAETFERAVRLWHRFDPSRGSERTWLCQIARTAALDHLRAEERRRRREQRYASVADRHHEPNEQTLSPWLRSALDSLSAADREVIALRVILELDAASAGRVLGITASACTTRLARALEKLERNARSARVA